MRAPRLIDLRWGAADSPKVTLVGKGVCFDTGGLDLKPSAGMALMKKDMGGAACRAGARPMLMESRCAVRLRVLIPAVENAIAGNAYRPGDVIQTRAGVQIEIGNTDAEGPAGAGRCPRAGGRRKARPADRFRDAHRRGTHGARSRTAGGCIRQRRQETIDALLRAGRRVADPLWQMPLWSGYDDDIASKVADINNASSTAFAGSIIGALFLQRFVTERPGHWAARRPVRLEPRERPGRPVGAEAQCLRARVPVGPRALRMSAVAPRHLHALLAITLDLGLNLVVSKVGVGDMPPMLFTALRFCLLAALLTCPSCGSCPAR